MGYTRLSKEQIDEARVLKGRGKLAKEIARKYAVEYGVHRTTVYRYITDNPDAYRWKQRAPKEDSPLRPFVQHFKKFGFTSLQLSRATGIPLEQINQAWI